MEQQKFDDTIPDKHGFTECDIISIVEDGDLDNWTSAEQEYIKERYKYLTNRRVAS